MTRTREENAAIMARDDWRRRAIKALTTHLLNDRDTLRDVVEDHYGGFCDDALQAHLDSAGLEVD